MKSDKWWEEKKALAEKNKSVKEGIPVREEMAKAFYDEHKYEESAKMWYEMAGIARMYPELEKYSTRYVEIATTIKEEFERQKMTQPSHYSVFFLAITASTLTILGILLLSPNFTGAVINTPESNTANWIGSGLILLGVLFGIWFISKK